MNESKWIIILSLVLLVIQYPLSVFLKFINVNNDIIVSVVSNFSCALIVSLVTAICQYNIIKRKIINTLYRLYFNLYRYFYFFNQQLSYNDDMIKNLINEINETKLKIDDILSEYSSIFNTKGSFINRITVSIDLSDIKSIVKNVNPRVKTCDDKSIKKLNDYLFNIIKTQLSLIDNERFIKDREELSKELNYIFN